MSRIRADKLVNRLGTGGPTFPNGVAAGFSVTGIITATSFSGDGSNLDGVGVAGVSTTGTSTFNDVVVDGNLTVNGTQTIINTATLEVEDKNIGIASVSSPSNTTADGAGLTVYGGGDGDKTLKWLDSTDRWTFDGGAVQATAFYGDGSQLDNVVSGVTLKADDSLVVGGAATTINFSGATISEVSSGIATITIASGGISTAAASGGSITLDLSSAQDHKVTATGITTITVSGGTEGDSHTVRIVNSGIATVGFSTYFLFPSGSPPVLPTASGAISLVSFTINQVGAGGTQLLAGASLNFS